MCVNFITFGSHSGYIDAGNRLIQQANNLNIFTETNLYTSEDLKLDQSFWPQHNNFINNNHRGYGYWLWKPYLIKKKMEEMKDGDVLLYLDCGCEIDYREKEDLLNCIDIVKKDKIVGTYICIENEYNKMDLIEKLNMNKDIYILIVLSVRRELCYF